MVLRDLVLHTQFSSLFTCIGKCFPENLLAVSSKIIYYEKDHNLSWEPPQLMYSMYFLF